MSRNRNNNGRPNNNPNMIPDVVKEFMDLNWETYKKKNKKYFDSKKELREDYYDTLIFSLPEVIDFIIRKGHNQNQAIQEAKDQCLVKFSGPDSEKFVEFLTERIDEDGADSIENVILLPIILHEMIGMILAFNKEHENEPDQLLAMPDELFKLSETILKKRLKKAEKKGIPNNLAFDLLSIMPSKDAIEYSPWFRVRQVFDVIYQHASNENLNFEKLMKFLFREDAYPYIIGYALQERKDKYRGFNESQKKIFNDINTWIFTELEEMDVDDICDILRNYVKVRKNDAQQGKDSNRRYYIASLPENMYPHICKAVARIKNQDSEAEKYL